MNTIDTLKPAGISADRSRKSFYFLLTAIFLLALFLRMHNLSERTFDHWDEGWYAASAGSAIIFADYVYSHFNEIIKGHFDTAGLRKSVKENSPVLFGASGKPVLSVILLFGFILGGFNQFSLFFEMVIISLISMYIVYATGVRLFDKRVGLMAAFFFAVSGIMVHYSRTCMPQMVMVLFCMLIFYSSLRIGEGKWAIIFGFSSALAFFTHPATGLILVSIWAFVGIILLKIPREDRVGTVLKVVLGLVPSAIILFLIAELPQWLFKSQISTYDSYIGNVVRRGVDKGISHGIFSSIDQISYLFMNIWESEFVSVAFVIFSIVILLCKCRKLPQLMIIIIPLCFTLIYFFMGISYRFRMFIVIYPFLYILAGVGFIYVYDFLLSKKRLRGLSSTTKIVCGMLILVLLLNGMRSALNSKNFNAQTFQKICSELECYLANLPKGERRAISCSQGNLSTWFAYYFSRNRIKHSYPYLTKSLIWDWKIERPDNPSVGDILIIVEGQRYADLLSCDRFKYIVSNKMPIKRIPYNVIDRDRYLFSVFKRKWVFINIYDLKT